MNSNKKILVKGIGLALFGGTAVFVGSALMTDIVSADAAVPQGQNIGIALIIGGSICIIGVIIGLLTVYFAD
jgi:hypothetical protein